MASDARSSAGNRDAQLEPTFRLAIDPWVRARFFHLLALALLPLAVILQIYRLLETEPGFYIDESSVAYNAWTIATSGVDEHGIAWPLFFRAFGDFKSPVLIYLMAGAFKLFGPSILLARLVSVTLGLIGGLALGVLAARTSRRPLIGFFVTAMVLLTPQLFELERLVFETGVICAVMGLYLLLLSSSPPDHRWSGARIAGLAVLLAILAYSYTGTRLLAPLLAFGLIVYFRRPVWTNVALVWLVFAALVAPMAAYALNNPTFLTARLDEAGYLKGSTLPDIAARFINQYLGNLDPRHLLLVGDANHRHHVDGVTGPILFGTLVLAIIGLDRVIHRYRASPWWRYVLYGTVVSLIPASLTTDEWHAQRLILLPIFLTVLAMPALTWLAEPGAEARATLVRRGVLGALVAATMFQGLYFQVRFQQLAADRYGWLDGEFPELLDEALATGANPIYLVDAGQPAYIHAYWYGVLRGIPLTRFVHLASNEPVPSGATVLSGDSCSGCVLLSTRGFFKLYVAP